MCRIYFYSRPCGRGDGQQILKVYEAKAISTHAPAGGATDCRAVFREPCFISTHAPAGGATGMQTSKNATGKNFYSRPCGRGDSAPAASSSLSAAISTHAPAGGATDDAGGVGPVHTISTHAPAGGATSCWPRSQKKWPRFLLTPLREGRPSSRARSSRQWYRFLLTPLREGRPEVIDE